MPRLAVLAMLAISAPDAAQDAPQAVTAGRLNLVCTGSGSATKADEDRTYFSEQVNLWIEGTEGRIRQSPRCSFESE